MSFTSALEGLIEHGKCPKSHNLLHSVSDGEGVPEIDSHYVTKAEPTTWTARGDSPIPPTASVDNSTTYTIAAGTAHILQGSFLSTHLPSVSVIDEYQDTIRVSWGENIGHHTVEKAIFEYDPKTRLELPPIFLDCEHQYNLESGAGKRRMQDAAIGNVPELTEYNTYLPTYHLYVRQPWFYWHQKSFWPLFKCRSHPTKHIYTFRSYKSLLRIQQLQEGEWVTLSSTAENVDRYVTFGVSITPVLIGRYAQLSDEEYEVNTSPGCVEESVVFIRDTVVFSEPKTYGDVIGISLKPSHICPYFYFLVSNEVNTVTGNHARYTNQYNDHSIVSSTLTIGGNVLFEKMGPQGTNVAQGTYFRSVPRRKGYNAYSFVFDPNNDNGDSAPILGKTSETTTQLIVETRGKSGEKCNLHVVMVILRPLHFKQLADGSFSVRLGD